MSFRRFKRAAGGAKIANYLHGTRIGVLVEFEGDETAAKDVAMHVAAMKPVSLTSAEVPAELIEKERSVAAAKAAESGKPADIVNNVLQLRLVKASENLLRFGMNTVFGLGGLFDVASAAGMPENDTDFGETLHIWGVGEGAYLEVPFIGPSTERDLAGAVVDILIDPLNQLPR
jgi:elongation factor Ts